LERTGTRIEIVGDGPERDFLTRLAADRGVGGRVCLRGRLSDSDLALAYQAADLFVVPTLELEGFGVIVVEALGYGCPVIATRCGALPELLEPLPYAALCAPGSVSELRRLLEVFLDGKMTVPDPSELERYVEERFGRVVLRERYVEWLLGSRSA
jgi:glycosyltransferase involved in cell wall biosynthesis